MEEINEDSAREEKEDVTSEISQGKSGNIAVSMKKTWRDYVFEFILPFLAVMAAFLLNTEREDYVEHNLEKQYIQSIINDLRDDAKLIDEQTTFHKMRIGQMDSLMGMLEYPASIKDFDKLYYWDKLATRNVTFAHNGGTFEQMKNSASFRLIRNQDAAHGIINYYQKIKTINLVEEREKSDQDSYKRIAVQIFDPFADKHFGWKVKNKPNKNISLTFSNDKFLLRQLAGYIQYLNTSRSRLIFLKQDLKKTGDGLIVTLKKNYKLNEV
jgi:hypothetical protein